MAADIDGAFWSGPLPRLSKPAPISAIANREQDRVRMLTDAGPTVLLGTTALGHTKTPQRARAVSRDDFGFNPARAQSALRAAVDVFAGTTAYPIDALAGMPLTPALRALLRRLLPGQAQDAGAAAKRVSSKALRRHADHHSGGPDGSGDAVQSKTAPACSSTSQRSWPPWDHRADQFTSLLQSGLGSGYASPHYRGRQRTIDRVLSAAFALDSARQEGILLGKAKVLPRTRHRSGASGQHRGCSQRSSRIRRRRYAADCVRCDPLPQPHLRPARRGSVPALRTPSGDVSLAQDMGVSAAANLTKWYDRPMWFAGPKRGCRRSC